MQDNLFLVTEFYEENFILLRTKKKTAFLHPLLFWFCFLNKIAIVQIKSNAGL